MSRSGKTSLELIERQRGPEGFAALTVEVSSQYVRDFYEELKQVVPYGAWRYDESLQTWFILPRYRQEVARVAGQHFDVVWLVEGEDRTNWKTGQKISEPKLF
jgi:hypothetical protein